MDNKKAISFPFISQVVKPRWRNLTNGRGVAEIEAAEFRVRNALAGNSKAINLIFDIIARQALLGNNIFGPFILAGASGAGKTTLIKALATDWDPRLFVEFDLGACRASHEGAALFGAPPGYEHCGAVVPFAKNLIAVNEALGA